MINVIIKLNKSNSISGFNITGHAGYQPKGKDIICAGVSSLAQGILIGLVDVVKLKLEYSIEDGFIDCNISNQLDPSDMEKAQVLLKTLELGLKSIEKEYRKYICVTQTKEV